MRICALFTFLVFLVSAHNAHAYSIVFRDDAEAFFALAGNVREIGFETLPDGSPAVNDTLITDTFNYYDQGVRFHSPVPTLSIIGDETNAWLVADVRDSSARNWIIASFYPPVTAVGIRFIGRTTLSVFNDSGGLLVEARPLGLSGSFVGIIADEPIFSAIIDRGTDIQMLDSIVFTPVPEPSSLILFLVGGGVAFFRRGKLRQQALAATH